MIRRWNPPSVAAPSGQYSHVATVPAGHELVFVSGQLGLRPDGTLAGPDGDFPAHSLMVVTPEFAVEIEVVAAVPIGR
ncbi:hypothetical protein [Kutzneria chonburiensis]|uniref:RidA family protein n=1 Tax=Kutzneria chonburiensis TaxID=1483604 RepID=A0ABV6N9G4_9PSEU|nr:hypothetical protein [Kutzneria chonburiensis]